MKKFYIFFFASVLITGNAFALVSKQYSLSEEEEKIEVDFLTNFEPIIEKNDFDYQTVFNPLLEDIQKKTNISFTNTSAEQVNPTELFLGCFSETIKFEKYNVLYPAILTSPIGAITLPSTKINNTQDLKRLRAGVDKNEPFSDFIAGQIKVEHKAKEFESYDDMFAALFNKEIDYIITNYYRGVTKAYQTGIFRELSFVKKPMWTAPLFVCVKKGSKNYNRLVDIFNRVLKDENSVKNIKDNLIKTINDIRIENSGVSAPAYLKGNK